MPNVSHAKSMEEQYFHLNFLTLLRQEKNNLQIEALAEQANNNRLKRQHDYAAYLESISSGSVQPTVAHCSMDLTDIKKSPCIVALFHFGQHRNIITDLVLSGYKVAAPIAGQSYYDYYRVKEELSPEYGNNLKLLEVESSGVGLSLIRAARSADILAIYVDGNMGPDGHHSEEGSGNLRPYHTVILMRVHKTNLV